MSILDQLIVQSLPWMPRPLVAAVGKRYVAGETVEQMVQAVQQLNQEGCMATIDVLGEFVATPQEAREAAEMYRHVLRLIRHEGLNANVSIKLSQMGLLLDPMLCLELMREIVQAAEQLDNFVRIDMEDSASKGKILDIFQALRVVSPNVGIVIQACLRKSVADIDRLIAQGVRNIRLCKGIYREPRQLAYQQPDLVNQNYLYLLERLFENQVYVGIATHDERLVWGAMRLIERYRLTPGQYEFQMLLGVDPLLRALILDAGCRVRVYVPFGGHWMAYSLRRLHENPTIARHVVRSLFAEGLGFKEGLR